MSVKIISNNNNKLTLQVEVELSGSMLEIEDKIQAACNAVGSLGTEKGLEHFDADGTPIIIGEKKIYCKAERE
jgi:hypothetical protein